ncbi:hypothetical protein BJX65DRAFT_306420 [Aspergillus insuetus]
MAAHRIGFLPIEIWDIIIDMLQWDSPATLRSLNLSCRDLHQRVSPVLFRTLRIIFATPRPSSGKAITLPNWEAAIRAETYAHVRFLVISGRPDSEGKNLEYPVSIQRLIESLPNLKSIRWRGIPFPPDLFRILKDRGPNTSLFYYEGRPNHLINNNALIGAPYIKSLSITCAIKMYSRRTRDMSTLTDIKALGDVVLSFPNLERLVLKHEASYDWKRAREPLLPLFHLDPKSKLPPSLRALSLASFRLTLSRRLHGRGVFNRGLRSFKIRVLDGDDTQVSESFLGILDKFLGQITSLHSFATHDLPKEVLHFITRHHGAHLRQLRFRETRFPQFRLSPDIDCLFSPEEIEQLARGVPLVERLGLDLRLQSRTPYPHLAALSHFPSLKHLELNTPNVYIKCLGPEPLKPWLSKLIAQEIFQYVDKRTAGRLTNVDIKVTEWEAFLTRTSQARPLQCSWVFAAWRRGVAAGANTSGDVDVLFQWCSPQAYAGLIEDDLYEQLMDSLGLGRSRMEDFGPPVF